MQSSGSLAKVPVWSISHSDRFRHAFTVGCNNFGRACLKFGRSILNKSNGTAILSYGFALGRHEPMLFYLSIDRLPLGIAVSFEFIGPLSVALFSCQTNALTLSGSAWLF